MASLLVGVALAVVAFLAVTLLASSTGFGGSWFPTVFAVSEAVRAAFFGLSALMFLSSGIPSLMMIGVVMVGLGALWYVWIRNDGDVDVSPR